MKANELRIGNLFKDRSGKILRLDFWDGMKPAQRVFVERLEVHPLTEDLEYCQAIPLTEEWLSKFGFEKEPCPHNETMYYWIPNIFSLEKSIEHDSSIVFSHDWGEVEIKYVHELQNLYWVLFGEELTLKE